MSALREKLRQIVGADGVLYSPTDLSLYARDAYFEYGMPDIVVLPETVDQVSDIVKLAGAEGIPVIPRGAGTGLNGGATPTQGGLVISVSRMKKILDIDLDTERVLVEAGVANASVTDAVRDYGYHFVPDPSSRISATVGGNVGCNAGGLHCLKYGITSNHVAGLEMVLPSGEVMYTGELSADSAGYDLTGVICGSEGQLGIVTKVLVKIKPLPESFRTVLAIFDSISDAANTVSAIIRDGIVPAAMEFMDGNTIGVIESVIHAGYPTDAGALLVIEPDGPEGALDRQVKRIQEIARQHGATKLEIARTAADSERLWLGRRGTGGALAQIARSYYNCDITVPRTRIEEALREINKIAEAHGLAVINTCHIGDGNLHPTLLFDELLPEDRKRVLDAGLEFMKLAVRMGGTISGEHGIGIEKAEGMRFLFTGEELELMKNIKQVFDPPGIWNPGKVFPGAFLR